MARGNPERNAAMARMWLSGVPTAEVAAEFGVKCPAVMATLRRVGIKPPCRPRAEKRVRRTQAQIMEDVGPLVRVDRDPCFFCGVRGDVGCSHRRAR